MRHHPSTTERRALRGCLIATIAVALSACASTQSASREAPSPAAGSESAVEVSPESAQAPTATSATGAEKTLFERLGGLPAIEAVVTEFGKNVAADERINYTFGLTDMPTLHRHLVEFFCAATGGPCKYSGRDMRAAHRHMGLTGEHFAALVGDLIKTLDTFKVPEREKGEILAALGPTRKDIVEVE